ncbi:alpha/beta hydrolase [Pseudolysinimonas sp.]|uniref:alpha/beta hydrolase n=1 Tax=Pseudolysinimonas sp. TaxID=2680009 RepID=UPI003F7CF36F
MDLSTEHRLDDGLVEHRFALGDADGILWTPPRSDGTTPVILLGHPGQLDRMRPRLVDRARRAARSGFASATLELPGAGSRPPIDEIERARADMRAAFAHGEPVGDDVIDRLVLPLVDRAAPEWRALLDEVRALPGLDGPAAWSGGIAALGVRVALEDPRIAAGGLFAGSFVPRATLAEARRVTVPMHVLLQWDDEGNDRERSLALFDALGSAEKTLQANLGGHTGVPASAAEDAARFFERHLRAERPVSG